VKLLLLAGSGVAQAIFFWIVYPLDWMPHFGTSDNAADSIRALRAGYHCVFFQCPGSFSYFLAFFGCYFMTMIGLALLNAISAPLTAMVSQMAAPLAGLTLLVIPAWDVTSGSNKNTYEVVGALLLITAGSLLYVYWEQWMPEHAEERSLDEGETLNLLKDERAFQHPHLT